MSSIVGSSGFTTAPKTLETATAVPEKLVFAHLKKDAASVCPNCSTELHGHRCEVVCKKCGFF